MAQVLYCCCSLYSDVGGYSMEPVVLCVVFFCLFVCLFFNRTLPVSSGCLPVCISEYFCRRRKGDSHVKYKYTDSEYPQHWSVQVCMKSRERQGTGGRGLTQPLTSLVPLASVLAPSPRDQPCPGRGQRESTGQPPSWGLRRCWGP